MGGVVYVGGGMCVGWYMCGVVCVYASRSSVCIVCVCLLPHLPPPVG